VIASGRSKTLSAIAEHRAPPHWKPWQATSAFCPSTANAVPISLARADPIKTAKIRKQGGLQGLAGKHPPRVSQDAAQISEKLAQEDI
jgi:hypothetical protein